MREDGGADAFDVLVVTATDLEGARLVAALADPARTAVAGRALVAGRLGPRRVGVLTAGLGKVNAALALGAALERVRERPPRLLLAVGVGGAYPSSGLAPGDLAVATEEVYGDEGVETGRDVRGLEAIGIPLQECGGQRLFHRFPADADVAERLGAAAEGRAPRCAAGPFVTVSTVTGTARTAERLERTWGAVCESMEGAAVAHAAAAHGIAFGEVRGISNRVGPRDRAAWRVAEAAGRAQAAARAFLEAEGEVASAAAPRDGGGR